MPSLNNLKPVQVKELSDLFEKLPTARAIPSRYRRDDKSQRMLAVEQNASSLEETLQEDTKSEGTSSALNVSSSNSKISNIVPTSKNTQSFAIAPQTPTVDEYELSDPVSFLNRLPKNFYQDLNSSKWKERKEALDSLNDLLSFPKLEDGRYHELVNALAKVFSIQTKRIYLIFWFVSACCRCQYSGSCGCNKLY